MSQKCIYLEHARDRGIVVAARYIIWSEVRCSLQTSGWREKDILAQAVGFQAAFGKNEVVWEAVIPRYAMKSARV